MTVVDDQIVLTDQKQAGVRARVAALTRSQELDFVQTLVLVLVDDAGSVVFERLVDLVIAHDRSVVLTQLGDRSRRAVTRLFKLLDVVLELHEVLLESRTTGDIRATLLCVSGSVQLTMADASARCVQVDDRFPSGFRARVVDSLGDGGRVQRVVALVLSVALGVQGLCLGILRGDGALAVADTARLDLVGAGP